MIYFDLYFSLNIQIIIFYEFLLVGCIPILLFTWSTPQYIQQGVSTLNRLDLRMYCGSLSVHITIFLGACVESNGNTHSCTIQFTFYSQSFHFSFRPFRDYRFLLQFFFYSMRYRLQSPENRWFSIYSTDSRQMRRFLFRMQYIFGHFL